MTGDAPEQVKTDKVGKRHTGEKNKRIGQTVDLVERALIFLNQSCGLLSFENYSECSTVS